MKTLSKWANWMADLANALADAARGGEVEGRALDGLQLAGGDLVDVRRQHIVPGMGHPAPCGMSEQAMSSLLSCSIWPECMHVVLLSALLKRRRGAAPVDLEGVVQDGAARLAVQVEVAVLRQVHGRGRVGGRLDQRP